MPPPKPAGKAGLAKADTIPFRASVQGARMDDSSFDAMDATQTPPEVAYQPLLQDEPALQPPEDEPDSEPHGTFTPLTSLHQYNLTGEGEGRESMFHQPPYPASSAAAPPLTLQAVVRWEPPEIEDGETEEEYAARRLALACLGMPPPSDTNE